MEIQTVPISAVKANASNPRLIKDIKFKKLMQSISDLPSMLALRPIVVNKDMTVLGGNMRYAACVELGYTDVPIIIADDLTDEEQQQFVIKDNVSFGEFDFEILANEYNSVDLAEWGVDVWQNEDDLQSFEDIELNIDDNSNDTKRLSIEFTADEYDNIIQRLNLLSDKYDCSDYRALLYTLLDNENV